MSTFIAEIRVDVRTEISRVNRLRLLILARNYLIVALRNLKYTVAVALVLMALSARVEAHNDEWALAVPLEEISIDGDLGDWPRGMLKYPIVRVGGGEQPRDSSDFQGTFRVGYSASERALYVAVEVQDESLVVDDSVQANWLNQDGCDVYVDVAHGERDGTVVQYVLWGQERARYGAQGKLDQWQDAEVSARRDGGTQVYEWRIDLGAMGPDLTLRPGRVLGFDLALMDRDRDDSYSWMHWGPGTGKVRSPRALGDLLLAGPGEVMGSVRGRVAWNDGAERPPPRAVQVHSVDGRSLWKIRTDGNGSYAMDMPAATYRITLVDFRLGTNDRIEVEVSVTGGKSSKSIPSLPPMSLPLNAIVECAAVRWTASSVV